MEAVQAVQLVAGVGTGPPFLLHSIACLLCSGSSWLGHSCQGTQSRPAARPPTPGMSGWWGKEESRGETMCMLCQTPVEEPPPPRGKGHNGTPSLPDLHTASSWAHTSACQRGRTPLRWPWVWHQTRTLWRLRLWQPGEQPWEAWSVSQAIVWGTPVLEGSDFDSGI